MSHWTDAHCHLQDQFLGDQATAAILSDTPDQITVATPTGVAGPTTVTVTTPFAGSWSTKSPPTRRTSDR